MKHLLSNLPIQGQNTLVINSELADYFENKFTNSISDFQKIELPWDIHFWEKNVGHYQDGLAFEFLTKCFPQLCFQIGAEMNNSEDYKNAVFKGKKVVSQHQLLVQSPHEIELFIHKSLTMRIPVMIVPNENDFVKIMQALLYQNKQVEIPQSTGASLIIGLNNWEKLRGLKRRQTIQGSYLQNHSDKKYNLVKPRYSYKDALIILSKKPYSNVSASELQIDEDLWLEYALNIRLEHEFVHLFTRQFYGQMAHNLHDELVADYIGIIKTIGFFDTNWMYHFMGLEDYPSYRKGARMENYTRGFSIYSENYELIMKVYKSAIDNLKKFDNYVGGLRSEEDQISRIRAICSMSLIDLAKGDGELNLIEAYSNHLKSEKSKNAHI